MEDAQAQWLAEYEFWHKIITEEVERFRFNQGYEPIEVEIYSVPKTFRYQPDYIGLTRIGHQTFRVVAFKRYDAEGKEVLKVQILPE